MANITKLPGGCSRSELSVFPRNWDKKDASIDEIWRVEYRFYEPAHDPYRMRIKDFSRYKNCKDRQYAVSLLLKDEKEKCLSPR